MTKAMCYLVDLKMQEEATSQETQAMQLQKLQRQGKGFSSRGLRESTTYGHRDSDLAKLISDFWPSEQQENKVMLL